MLMRRLLTRCMVALICVGVSRAGGGNVWLCVSAGGDVGLRTGLGWACPRTPRPSGADAQESVAETVRPEDPSHGSCVDVPLGGATPAARKQPRRTGMRGADAIARGAPVVAISADSAVPVNAPANRHDDARPPWPTHRMTVVLQV